jgi:hypothetical protein
MTMKLPELWLQYASDDLKSAKVLLAEGVYNKDIDTVLRPLVGERINPGSMPKDDS